MIPSNGIDCAMPSDSTKLLVDLREEEGSRKRWQGSKMEDFFPREKSRRCALGGGGSYSAG